MKMGFFGRFAEKKCHFKKVMHRKKKLIVLQKSLTIKFWVDNDF